MLNVYESVYQKWDIQILSINQISQQFKFYPISRNPLYFLPDPAGCSTVTRINLTPCVCSWRAVANGPEQARPNSLPIGYYLYIWELTGLSISFGSIVIMSYGPAWISSQFSSNNFNSANPNPGISGKCLENTLEMVAEHIIFSFYIHSVYSSGFRYGSASTSKYLQCDLFPSYVARYSKDRKEDVVFIHLHQQHWHALSLGGAAKLFGKSTDCCTSVALHNRTRILDLHNLTQFRRSFGHSWPALEFVAGAAVNWRYSICRQLPRAFKD